MAEAERDAAEPERTGGPTLAGNSRQGLLCQG